MRRKGRKFPIVLAGIPYILPSALICVLMGIWGNIYLFIPCLVLTLFILSFFRNPPRRIPDGEELVLSPADGRILGVDEGVEVPLFGGKATKVSIFMSVFNVHVNRIPTGGVLEEVRYQRGRFLPANKAESSRQNEQNAIVVHKAEGLRLICVQVAGIIARRIVCYMRRGDLVKKGEIFGVILFGSRVDVYLPPGVKVIVHEGERVKGGKSIVGVIQ